MDNMLSSLILEKLPRLSKLLGSREIHARDQEFQRLGMVPLWQVERDLELLARHRSSAEIAAAYRDLLRNTGKFIEAMYEIRVAAMLSPFANKLELAPKVGSGKCGLRCEIASRE